MDCFLNDIKSWNYEAIVDDLMMCFPDELRNIKEHIDLLYPVSSALLGIKMAEVKNLG